MTTNTAAVQARPVGFAVFSILLGILGWFASFELATEYIKKLKEPGYIPNCSVSKLVTCGPNMDSAQGSLFGFSNTILGLAAFVAPIAVGVALLAGARFASWFWGLYQVGLLLGFVFVCWLQYQSFFSLGTLCPWCMVVWTAMIPL
ncbi:MAG: vitamin K epoxide reductase family protein, partial [Actinobacteria bacterium]|nr:vitamin K epoxide reductase family protein [Actinomycetota bacterium]